MRRLHAADRGGAAFRVGSRHQRTAAKTRPAPRSAQRRNGRRRAHDARRLRAAQLGIDAVFRADARRPVPRRRARSVILEILRRHGSPQVALSRARCQKRPHQHRRALVLQPRAQRRIDSVPCLAGSADFLGNFRRCHAGHADGHRPAGARSMGHQRAAFISAGASAGRSHRTGRAGFRLQPHLPQPTDVDRPGNGLGNPRALMFERLFPRPFSHDSNPLRSKRTFLQRAVGLPAPEIQKSDTLLHHRRRHLLHPLPRRPSASGRGSSS